MTVVQVGVYPAEYKMKEKSVHVQRFETLVRSCVAITRGGWFAIIKPR